MNLGKNLRWMYEEYWKAKRDRVAEDEYVREQGRAEGKAESILQALSRFGDISAGMRERILNEKDLATLDEWFQAALEADSLQEFMERTHGR